MHRFLGSLFAAVEPALDGPGLERVFVEARAASEHLPVAESAEGRQIAVCSWLQPALDAQMPSDTLNEVTNGLKALAPHLSWFTRPDATGTGSPNFPDGHGNAIIVGPDGLAVSSELWIGVSLLAPGVRYPDHTHPPEELYLVLSPGDFRNAETQWRAPGVGGLFHNPPGIVHAMRSGDDPLLAVWMLVPAAD
ncbi:transcriptional regulator [Hwanghaeella grinnelliae]|uniref:Transcriptional regulator n=1 Tax=Hwanghaeella grinnelliae TaxID=2500179 RepID=A0A437QL80_9PROT|nr:transcriptional regulator [Hwanghaeella grinnelliae]